jgi:hypothetical protein
MLAPTMLNAGGKQFQLYPIPAMKALRLDRQTLKFLAPLLPRLSELQSKLKGKLATAPQAAEGDPNKPETQGDGQVAQALSNRDLGAVLGEMSGMISDMLSALDDDTFMEYAKSMLDHAAYLHQGKPMQLNSEQAWDIAFQGEPYLIYNLLFNIMRYNNFSPFALVGFGAKTEKTVS